MRAKAASVFLAVVVCVALVAGCSMVVDPDFQPQARSNQLEPEAGAWETWVLDSVDTVQPGPPPDAEATQAEIEELKTLAADLSAEDEALVAYWNAGAPNYRWIELALAEHAEAAIPPTPRFARGMALLNLAIYDATVAAWEAKYTYNRAHPSEVDSSLSTLLENPDSPSYPSEHAAAAGAAAAVLSYLFPDHAAEFAVKADEAARSRLLAGVHYPSDVEAGLALGQAVAEQVLARAITDGSDVAWDGTMPTGAGYWTGENPVQPTAGSWGTWVLSSGDQLRPPPPPAYDSEQMQIELDALKAITPTFAQLATAYYWQTPRGAFPFTYATVNRLIFERGLDANPPQAARIYAAVAAAHQDAFIGCYDAKYAYWSMRPFQVDPEFKGLFPSPNFPAYPSAHSCQSSATSTILAEFFPAEREALFTTVEEIGNARMWAGIHFQSDIDAGRDLGVGVGELVIARVEEMTGPIE